MDKNRHEKNLFLLFSHTLTPEQLADARASLGVKHVFGMSRELKSIWQQIPPEVHGVDSLIEPLKKWLSEKSRQGDVVLVQGDFGATWLMVNYAFSIGLIPIYSTTEREASESLQPDGSIKTRHIFRHNRFRIYGH